MTCPACGALPAQDAERCPACGQSLVDEPAGTADEVEVVIKPRPVPTEKPSQFPGIVAQRPSLVIDFDDLATASAPLPEPAAAPVEPWPAPSPEPTTDVLGAAPAWAPPAAPQPWEVVGEGIAPPVGPPALPPGPPAARPPWRHPAVIGSGIAALLIVLAIGAWLTLFQSSDDEQIAGSALQASQTRVTDLSRTTGQATRVAKMREIGRRAKLSASELEPQQAAIAKIENRDLRGAATEALNARRRYLDRLGGLTKLTDAELRRQGMPGWASSKAALDGSPAELQRTQEALKEFDLPGKTLVDTKSVAASTAAIDKKARSASFVTRKYYTEVRAWERRRDAANARIAGVASYRDAVASALSSYQQSRDGDGQRFTGHVDELDYDDARVEAADLQNTRIDTLASLATQEANAPGSVSDEHLALSEPVQTSRDAYDSAQTAIDAAELFDEDVTDQGDWDRFLAQSDEAGSQLETAEPRWRAAVESEIQRIRNTIGDRPSRPEV